ncbi:MAG: CRISPR-associated endonuclease Cas1 [Ardenticatenales bacterium]|nr:CRISPR-associated endonuclease Cas1 [Ardenticatenales bacterium]
MAIVRHLIVERQCFISKHQGRLKVLRGKETVAQAPLMHLESVLVTGSGVTLSSDAIAACCSGGIPIHFVDELGRAYGALYSSGLIGTIRTRREQLAAYHDQRALTIARALTSAKLQNQAGLLRYMAKYRKESAPESFVRLREAMTEILVHESRVARVGEGATHIDELREPLMLLEAHAAQHYWRGFATLLPEGIPWPGREGRGSRDAANSVINYAYGILYNEIERAILLAGLDPYAGFVHADRPGKYSLVLDMVEPFRQPVADRAILNFLGKGGAIEQDEKGWLSEGTRKELAERVLERLDRPVRHDDKHLPLRHLIQQQARSLATFVRGERGTFDPYAARW